MNGVRTEYKKTEIKIRFWNLVRLRMSSTEDFLFGHDANSPTGRKSSTFSIIVG